MITRVLFIDSDAEALARIKQALEAAGDFEAKVFVTGEAALEYASLNPPTVAVISLNVQDVSPARLVDQLRAIRPGLVLLLRAPTETDEQVIAALNPEGVLHGGYSARVLLPMLEDTLYPAAREDEDLPPGVSASMRYLDEDAAAFGEILRSIEPGAHPPGKQDTFDVLVDSMRGKADKPSLPQRQRLANWARAAEAETEAFAQQEPEPANDVLFQKLAAEEPPMPTLDDTGTVRDLIAITDFEELSDSDSVEIPEEMIRAYDEIAGIEFDEVEQDLLDALAAADMPDGATTPLTDAAASTVQELIPMPDDVRSKIEAGSTRPIEAPAVEATGTPPPDAPEAMSVATPPDNRPADTDAAALALQLTQHTLKSSAQATLLMRHRSVIASAGDLSETDIDALIDLLDYETVLSGGKIKIKFVSLPDSGMNHMAVAAPTVDDMVLVMVFTENMHLRGIRQQAKTLTEALLATYQSAAPPPDGPARPGVQPVGELDFETPAPDASEQVLTATYESEDSQFGTTGTMDSQGDDGPALAVHGEDTQGAGDDIREATESEPLLDPAELVKYACAWILRDPEAELDSDLVDALPVWLDKIITAHHWLPEQIDVQPDYISVVISVAPGDTPSQVVETLMDETAQRVLAARPELSMNGDPAGEPYTALWADAYYIVAPGRPLTHEELSNFISYQRES